MDVRRALLLPGDLLRLAATCVLLHKLRKTRSSQGVSLQAQVLLALVHACRYADLLPAVLSGSMLSYQPSIYHIAMKVIYIATSTVAAMSVWHLQRAEQQRQQQPSTGRQAAGEEVAEVVAHAEQQAASPAGAAAAEPAGNQAAQQQDVLRPAVLLVPCALLALLCAQAPQPLELLWTFSIFLETVAALPQLLLMERCPCDRLTVVYVAMLGACRAFSLASWTWRLLVDPIFGPDPLLGPSSSLASPSLVTQWACGVLQLCLFADFFVARVAPRKALRPAAALCLLAVARLASALLRIPGTSPTETYAGLEPVHFLLYRTGQLGWEYGAGAALRSIIYPCLHAAALAPIAAALGQPGKIVTLFVLRCMLGFASAATGAWLYRAVAGRYRPAVAHCLLLYLCLSPGLVVASTAMLPASFSMCCLTAAVAAFLESRSTAAVVAATVGLVWGWPAAAPLLAPCLAWALWQGPAAHTLRTFLLCLLTTLGPQLLMDRIFYGRWVVTQLSWAAHHLWPSTAANSGTAGLEGASFYWRSAGSDFGLLLPLAFALPLLVQLPGAARSLCAGPAGPGLPMHVAKDGASPDGSCDGEPGMDEAEPGSKEAESGRQRRRALLLAVQPVYAWSLLLSLLPHKQAHFMYPVYQLVCLAAAAACVLLYALSKRALLRAVCLPRRGLEFLLRTAAALLLVAACVLALGGWMPRRMEAQGPERALTALPHEGLAGDPIRVCVGAEWGRFPSSFYLRGQRYIPQYFGPALSPRADPTLEAHLPRPYSRQQGGLLAWPSSQRFALNKAWHITAEQCDYVFTLVTPELNPPPPEGSDAPALDGDHWEQVSGWLPAFYPVGSDHGAGGALPWFAPYWLPSQAAGSAFWAQRTALGTWVLLRRANASSNSSSLGELGLDGADPTLAGLRYQVDQTEGWRGVELARVAAGLPYQQQRTWQWAGLWSLSGSAREGPHMPPVYIVMQFILLAAVVYYFYTVSTAQATPQQAAAARPTLAVPSSSA